MFLERQIPIVMTTTSTLNVSRLCHHRALRSSVNEQGQYRCIYDLMNAIRVSMLYATLCCIFVQRAMYEQRCTV